MDGAILYFNQLFIFETINYAEQPLWRSRFDNRTSAILDRQPVSKRYHRGILRFSLKPQNAPQKKPKPEKCSCDERKPIDLSVGSIRFVFTRPAEKIGKGYGVAVRRKVNRPDVVQRNVGKETYAREAAARKTPLEKSAASLILVSSPKGKPEIRLTLHLA